MAKRRKYPAKRVATRQKKINAPILLVAVVLLAGVFFWAMDKYGILPYAYVTGELGLSDKAVDTETEFSVHYIDIGQGDSELIVSGDCTVLIDGGEVDQGAKVLAYLRKQGIEQLDFIIGSHPHSDHIGGLPAVINAVKVDKIILPKIPDEIVPTTQSYRNLLKAVKANNVTAVQALPGEKYDLGGVSELKIIAPASEKSENLNDYSVVCRVDYKETSFLFMGDAEKQEEADILSSGADIDVDVLKVGHHGSGTSSGKALLAAVTPRYAVIELGVENPYGHPNKAAMKRLKLFTDDIYQTAVNGNIVCSSDGEKLRFFFQKEDINGNN